jgi:hypothetical protein
MRNIHGVTTTYIGQPVMFLARCVLCWHLKSATVYLIASKYGKWKGKIHAFED